VISIAVTVLAVLAMTCAVATVSEAQCGQCEEAWDPTGFEDHEGCGAFQMQPGLPITSTTAPPMYRWHDGTWHKPAPADGDCHRL
jgi:hypothetical protein